MKLSVRASANNVHRASNGVTLAGCKDSLLYTLRPVENRRT